MMRPLTFAGLVLATLGLAAGCSSDGELQRVSRAASIRLLPTSLWPQDPLPGYAALDRVGAPTMLARRDVGAKHSGREMVLRRLGTSPDGTVSWLAPDGSGFAFRHGVLVETRGAGGDLMTADVSQLLALLRSGGSGIAKRFHGSLDGENRLVLHSYVCTVSSISAGSGRQVKEDCTGVDEHFVNTYGLAPGSAAVMTSRQHLSEETGSFQFLHEGS